MPLDQIFISDLLVRGIIGINPDERVNEQDININVVMWADTSRAAQTDDIYDAVNYRTITKRIIAHITNGEPMLVERLVDETRFFSPWGFALSSEKSLAGGKSSVMWLTPKGRRRG